MNYETIKLEMSGHVCTFTLNRPPVNAVNLVMREEIKTALDELEKNSDARAVIITGSGDKAFCAGMDIKDIANIGKGPGGSDLWTRIDRFPKPVIAALNGFALGGGCELALACHFRIMTGDPEARIGLTELNLGIIPGWGGTQRMTRLVGRSRAMELMLFSKKLAPMEALELGLIDRVSPGSEVLKDALKMAADLAKRPPIAVSSVMKCIIGGLDKGIDEGLRLERECAAVVAGSEDAREGFTAFLQKREPDFKGR